MGGTGEVVDVVVTTVTEGAQDVVDETLTIIEGSVNTVLDGAAEAGAAAETAATNAVDNAVNAINEQIACQEECAADCNTGGILIRLACENDCAFSCINV